MAFRVCDQEPFLQQVSLIDFDRLQILGLLNLHQCPFRGELRELKVTLLVLKTQSFSASASIGAAAAIFVEQHVRVLDDA